MQTYQKAQTLPPAQVVSGIKSPDSASSLKIPPPPDHPVQYGERVPDPKKPGKTKMECLDAPPVMPEPAPEPATAPSNS